MPQAPTTYETAKARVESGDFSFEAIGALTIAHGEKLVRDSERLDRSALLTNESAAGYVERYYDGCDLPDDCALRISFRERPADFGVPPLHLQATYRDRRGVTCIDLWDVWVESGALYGEC